MWNWNVSWSLCTKTVYTKEVLVLDIVLFVMLFWGQDRNLQISYRYIVKLQNHLQNISCFFILSLFLISKFVNVPTPYPFAYTFRRSPRTSPSIISDFCFLHNVVCYILGGITIINICMYAKYLYTDVALICQVVLCQRYLTCGHILRCGGGHRLIILMTGSRIWTKNINWNIN